jgi:SusD family.
MKKIKYILPVFIAASVVLSSCEDFLDVEPKTNVTTENYYRKIEDAERALIAAYDGWQRTAASRGTTFYIISTLMSDECFGGTGNTDGRMYQVVDRFDLSQASGEVNMLNGLWGDYYAGIFRCNILLQKLDALDWAGNTSTRNRIEGETRALRALMYFDMVRLWGNIPLLTEPTAENLPQANPKDVFALIIEDLKFAEANISADAYPKANAVKNDGRITTYAAKALIARVHLFYKGYENGAYDPNLTNDNDVLRGLEDIISSSQFDLVPEFKNLWPAASSVPVQGALAFVSTYAGDGNVETVLAQKFNTMSNDCNRWLVLMGMRNTNFSPYGRGWGACTVHPKIWDAFETNDSRREASIINIVEEGIEPLFNIPDQREYTGYSVKKYTPMAFYNGLSAAREDGSGDFQTSQHQDFVVVRYADILLMAAELGSAKAQEYFDKVRARAGLGSKPVTKENIMQERFYEFSFEAQRYWDLLRQGVDYTASVISEDNLVLRSGGNPDNIVISADNIRAKKGLTQIPQIQLSRSNEVLTQNPGW